MKKCLMLFLALATALSLAACKGEKDPKVIYDEATKKTSELASMDVVSAVSMQMTQGEDTTDIKMDLDMKMADINTENMRYLATGTTSLMGQNLDILMYYENGYYYMDSMGQKIKYAMDLDAMMKQIKQSTEGASVDSSYLKDITAKKDGDNQVLTFTVDAEKMDAYVQELMGQLGTNMEGVTYTIKEASGEATVNKEGYFTNSKIKMSLDMNNQDQTVTMVMDTDSTYNNPGQTVEVTAPDLEGYTEIDASALKNQ
ncbi:DUF6612 family protein [Lacrimispora saccharolytica]|uniref:Uncharacterized protein n=1 Tax=Lacrimispora saccharolytica (strain ATCC 35040 / DSM 2544 / NRCC 2533 / WM1) TaxID=610130 RepID=D9R0Q2_LACSW|nr:DUF6612 family protein [Lacrimispora saccharolytica]ADL02701.1 hypothetical protein Closa_0058 [[Clostridium] saccharolyticum WM1]QRV19082.1 hypothetical protein I6K70_16620 [Lacrimispora saccharolytica]